MQVMSNGRVRRTDNEWRELLERWEKSGTGVREFCRREKVQVSSFQRWEKRLRGSSIRSEFVPIVRATPPAPEPPSSWTVEVTLPNGVQLRFQG